MVQDNGLARHLESAHCLPWLATQLNERLSIAGKQTCVPFDLNHAFGSHVIINHEWSQKDRETFHDNGQPSLRRHLRRPLGQRHHAQRHRLTLHRKPRPSANPKLSPQQPRARNLRLIPQPAVRRPKAGRCSESSAPRCRNGTKPRLPRTLTLTTSSPQGSAKRLLSPAGQRAKTL